MARLEEQEDGQQPELEIPQELEHAENYVPNEALDFSRLDELVARLKEKEDGFIQ